MLFMYCVDDLNNINEELKALKTLADREEQSVYGIIGEVFTPHVDRYNVVCLKKAAMLSSLKNNQLIPFTDVDIISAKLMALHKTIKNRDVVEFDGCQYECKFSPLRLSKSGKTVSKWAKYFLLKLPNGQIDKAWAGQVREIWPEYFMIKTSKF
jgi:hypothetical protein